MLSRFGVCCDARRETLGVFLWMRRLGDETLCSETLRLSKCSQHVFVDDSRKDTVACQVRLWKFVHMHFRSKSMWNSSWRFCASVRLINELHYGCRRTYELEASRVRWRPCRRGRSLRSFDWMNYVYARLRTWEALRQAGRRAYTCVVRAFSNYWNQGGPKPIWAWSLEFLNSKFWVWWFWVLSLKVGICEVELELSLAKTFVSLWFELWLWLVLSFEFEDLKFVSQDWNLVEFRLKNGSWVEFGATCCEFAVWVLISEFGGFEFELGVWEFESCERRFRTSGIRILLKFGGISASWALQNQYCPDVTGLDRQTCFRVWSFGFLSLSLSGVWVFEI